MSEHRFVEGQADLERLVAELLEAPAYALDTEFHRERSYYPHLALVQVAWDGGLALVDPLDLDLQPLAKVLDGPGLAVAHAAEQDLEVLERACGTVPSRLFDTQVAAGFIGLSGPSLATLVERLLGRPLPKGDRLTDWTRRPLTPAQQDYAAADVVHLLDLHRVLSDELVALGRLAWSEIECDLLLRRPRQPGPPEQAWWRLREGRALRGRSRAVAQTVAAWRERRAEALDRPPRFVLPDLSLISVAHRPPRSPEELVQVRGLDGRHLRPAVVVEILAAIEEGLGLSDRDLCLPVADDLDRRLRPAAALAAAWVGQRAAELRIDATMLATRADIHALLRGDPDCRLANGWRTSVLGAPLRRLMAGDAALALGDGGGLALEERSRRPLDRHLSTLAATAPRPGRAARPGPGLRSSEAAGQG
ncbi:MAG: ribonuclease D [Acidimicrobiales bacterium]